MGWLVLILFPAFVYWWWVTLNVAWELVAYDVPWLLTFRVMLFMPVILVLELFQLGWLALFVLFVKEEQYQQVRNGIDKRLADMKSGSTGMRGGG